MTDYYGYTTANDAASSALSAGLIIFIIVCAVIGLAIAIFYLVALAKLFKKADRPGWAAIVPYYNVYTILDIVGFKWYYVFVYVAASVLSSVPAIGGILSIALFLFNIVVSIKLAKAFGKDTGYGVGIALLGIVFIPMLAFNKDVKYVGKTVDGDLDFNNLF